LFVLDKAPLPVDLGTATFEQAIAQHAAGPLQS
jgi:hypothetical protein